MNLSRATSEIFVPSNIPFADALARTTHLCIAAHQDDIEIMAAQPILECLHEADKWFTGVVMTDGRGSPRNGIYAKTTDDEMRLIRLAEQRKAALLGNYSAMIFLDYPSSEVKNANNNAPVEDLLQIIQSSNPTFVYTHNLADKHETHVAVAIRTIKTLRMLDKRKRPKRVIACEVWRSLDWVNDEDKVLMDLSDHLDQQLALLAVFDSQIAGGKRLDLAAMSRRQANATFFYSHDVDVMSGASFGMDLTPLI